MADTLRDGIRDLASAQAGWINALASTRGFFRNAPPALPPPPAPVDDEDQDDEDEDDVVDDESPTWIDNIKPLVDTAATSATNAIMDWSMNAGSKLSSLLTPKVAAPAPESADGGAAAPQRPPTQGFELGDLLDWRRSAKKGKSARHHPVKPVPLQARIMADPQLMAHVMAIKELLTPAEITGLFQLVSTMGESEQQEIVDMLRGYSPEGAAQAIRRVLLLEHQRCEARAAEPAPMRITPIRVPAPEAIPGTPPPPADEPDEPTTNTEP